jgi:hypothetical protein
MPIVMDDRTREAIHRFVDEEPVLLDDDLAWGVVVLLLSYVRTIADAGGTGQPASAHFARELLLACDNDEARAVHTVREVLRTIELGRAIRASKVTAKGGTS